MSQFGILGFNPWTTLTRHVPQCVVRHMIDFDKAIALASTHPNARLIAIDGLPLAGKSTLAGRISTALRAEIIYLDDFVKPEAEWRSRSAPSFPFDFIRYDEFLTAVKSLAGDGLCSYRLYDWETAKIRDEYRIVRLDRPVIVEGVSSLHPELTQFYDLRFWVESDAETMLQASLERGVGNWEREWRDLFLPSVDLYTRTAPQDRAEFFVAGRGTRQ
jgi:uridine kinase